MNCAIDIWKRAYGLLEKRRTPPRGRCLFDRGRCGEGVQPGVVHGYESVMEARLKSAHTKQAEAMRVLRRSTWAKSKAVVSVLMEDCRAVPQPSMQWMHKTSCINFQSHFRPRLKTTNLDTSFTHHRRLFVRPLNGRGALRLACGIVARGLGRAWCFHALRLHLHQLMRPPPASTILPATCIPADVSKY